MTESLQDLIELYKKEASNHGQGILDGNSKFTNISHDKLICHLESIKAHPRGPIELMKLLEDPNDSVSSWAATHLLRFCNERSLETLTRVSERSDLIGFSARMAIQEWKKGRLKGEEW